MRINYNYVNMFSVVHVCGRHVCMKVYINSTKLSDVTCPFKTKPWQHVPLSTMTRCYFVSVHDIPPKGMCLVNIIVLSTCVHCVVPQRNDLQCFPWKNHVSSGSVSRASAIRTI